MVQVYEELFDVRAKWRRIGLKLGLHPGTLDAIEQRQADRLEAVLLDWLRVTKGATWKQLIDALQSALVGEIQLAEKLELKYCSPGKTCVIRCGCCTGAGMEHLFYNMHCV